MLYHILYEFLYPLNRYWSPLRVLNVFQYITFRTAYASITALLISLFLGPWLITGLREFQIGQQIREEGPKSHQKKAGTPTMGGVLDRGLDRPADASMGQSPQPLRLARCSGDLRLCDGRVRGRLHQDCSQAFAGSDRRAKRSAFKYLSQSRCGRRFFSTWMNISTRCIRHRLKVPFFKAFAPDSSDRPPVLDAILVLRLSAVSGFRSRCSSSVHPTP